MTRIDVGARKYESKKEQMIANYHLDADKWVRGLKRAGLPSVKETRIAAYKGVETSAKENYAEAIRAVTGEYWKRRFIEAMSG
ncbi:MAG: hypothetical protein QXL22_01170 [Candidatus Nezhaarchaeales archaeon]